MTPPTEEAVVTTAPPNRPDLEKSFFYVVSLIFLLLMTLPYLWVWTAGPLGTVWGGLIGETFDSNVHLAWARQSRDGSVFFSDLFTTESFVTGDKPLFFNLLPFIWGKLARTGIPIIFWFHLTRVLAGVWALWEFFKLCQLVLPRASQRMIALYLVAFTTGASFLLLALPGLFSGTIFIDHPNPGHATPTMPEAFLFTSAFLFPLNIVSYGLMAYLFRKVVESDTITSGKHLFRGFLAAAALANIHTYDAIPVGLTLLGWMVWSLVAKKKHSALLCLFILIGLALPTIYQVVVFRNSEEFRIKALTPTTAPAFKHIFASFLPLFALFAVGLSQLKKNRHLALLAAWAFVTFICIYLPVSFARKMIEGGQMPLAILAGAGMVTLLGTLKSTDGRRIAVAIVLAILTISPLHFVIWDLNNAAENNASRYGVLMPPQYLQQSEWDALRFLDKQADKSVSVLSLPFIGAYGPRETGMRFYLSHWAETLYYTEKKIGLVNKFYKAHMSPGEASTWIKANKIRYVVETPFERAVFGTSGYVHSYGLTPVWTGGTGQTQTIIYAVPTTE